MALRLHNTLTRTTDVFTSRAEQKRVTLYTCGPTVYDDLHVGNWAAYIYWDILVRTLAGNGYIVERVMNITDVGHLTSDADDGEDKLEKGARREGKSAWQIAAFYSERFIDGMQQLGLLPPTHLTKATEFIPQQLELVRELHNKGYTYTTSDGIYFDTSKFAQYANFAHLDLESQMAGARVEFNTEKRNVSDFALWKFTLPGTTRDMEWETPLELTDGKPKMGFPGWHLECSAMAMSLLGSTIDIHTGGIDHIPVHHTNEIAQSESASGQLFARFWLHNNHLKVDGTKISKSLQNGFTLDDLTNRGFSTIDFRMFVLQSQYSSEGNFTFENLAAAKNRLHHWRAVAALRHQVHDTLVDDEGKADSTDNISLPAASQAVVEALNNDLNTPEALHIVDMTFSRLGHIPTGDIHRSGLVQFIKTIDERLGLQLSASTPDIDDETKQLILRRQRAREEKDWQQSDIVRETLFAKGIVVRDSTNGPLWEYA